jgi:dihydroorotate dehydrogenase electron transfer subunit
MKKYIMDMKVTENLRLNQNYCLLKLSPESLLPDMLPGQFVEVKVDNATTFLRRPISINYIDRSKNELWLLVQIVGDGTRTMAELNSGDWVNIILPLGNSFTIPEGNAEAELLLIGGGVGTAPMLYLGEYLKRKGFNPSFLLGARSAKDVLQLENFNALGKVYVTTEDGSLGEKGYVTQHSILKNKRFDRIYTCGPKPMMVAVAKVAHEASIDCEVSLENTMACGIGACLCCVEKTTEGNLCVCTEGPVFNIKNLTSLN